MTNPVNLGPGKVLPCGCYLRPDDAEPRLWFCNAHGAGHAYTSVVRALLQDEPGARLPTYEESKAAVERGDATPLQTFIYQYEPSLCDRHFRGALAAAMAFAANHSAEPTRERILARTFSLTTEGLFCGFCERAIPSAREPRKCCSKGAEEDQRNI
jgi:hypothetical protein